MINEKKKIMQKNRMKYNKLKELQTKKMLNHLVTDKIIILKTFSKTKMNRNILQQINKKA
jgi:hypothetical protein